MRRLTRWTLAIFLGTTATLQGGTKLTNAAVSGDIQAMKAALAAGEKVNDTDGYGWTALMWMTYYDLNTYVRWFLNHGADPNIKATSSARNLPMKITALGIAAQFKMEPNIASLMTAKADPEAKDSDGNSPLSIAKKSGCEGCVALMTGKSQPSSSLPLISNKGIKESVDDLFVTIDSIIPKSDLFLNDVKIGLDMELAKRHIRHLVYIRNPKNPEAEKELQALRDTFKPRFNLQWFEISANVFREIDRNNTQFRAVLKRNGETDPVWTLETNAVDSRFPLGYVGDAYQKLLQDLLDNMQADLLLP